jgi:hypothetical protein
MLLPSRASAFWEGHKKSSARFQKICWEEPEKQKTRRRRAQELSRSGAQWKGQNGDYIEPFQVKVIATEVLQSRLAVELEGDDVSG